VTLFHDHTQSFILGGEPPELRAEYRAALQRVVGMARNHLRIELLGLQMQHRVGGQVRWADQWYGQQAEDLGAALDVAAALVIAISSATTDGSPELVLDYLAALVEVLDG
jgi:hypothetical protein